MCRLIGKILSRAMRRTPYRRIVCAGEGDLTGNDVGGSCSILITQLKIHLHYSFRCGYDS